MTHSTHSSPQPKPTRESKFLDRVSRRARKFGLKVKPQTIEMARRVEELSPEELNDLTYGVYEIFKTCLYREDWEEFEAEGDVTLPRDEFMALFERAICAVDQFEPAFEFGDAAIHKLNKKRPWWKRLLGIGAFEDENWRRRLSNNRSCFAEVIDQVSKNPVAKTVTMSGDLWCVAKSWVRSYDELEKLLRGKAAYR